MTATVSFHIVSFLPVLPTPPKITGLTALLPEVENRALVYSVIGVPGASLDLGLGGLPQWLVGKHPYSSEGLKFCSQGEHVEEV